MLSKISCSSYNAAAIAENEDLYLWGSIQSGLLGTEQTKPQEIPKKFSFDKINLFFKALQVSVSTNHMAVVVGNKFLDKVQLGKYIDPVHKKILQKQAEAMKRKRVDPIIKYNLAQNINIPREEFIKILHNFNELCDYTKKEEEELPNFVDYFCIQNESQVSLVQYVYALNEELFATDKVLTWGFDDNGRLGHGNVPDHIDGFKIPEGPILEEDDEEDIEGEAKSDEEEKELREKQERNPIDMKNVLNIKYKPPKVVNIPHPVKKVACGQKFTIALDRHGTIWTWGKGSNGCLGTGNLNDAYKPDMIKSELFGLAKAERFIIDIAAGGEHCLALNEERNVFSWGNGKMGRLGIGTETSQLYPTKIRYFENHDIKIFRIDAGELHSACISDEKFEVYTFGCGANFRLGHGSVANELYPRIVATISEYYASQISCGLLHTLCLTTDGYIYAWGAGAHGRLGVDMVSDKDYLVPTRVGIVNDDFKKKSFVEVYAGPHQSFALTKDGELLSWGARKFKTLGIADLKKDLYFPMSLNLGLLKFYNNTQSQSVHEETKKLQFNAYELEFQEFIDADEDPFQVAKVFSGETNTVFLMTNGDLYITGSGQFGQLCLNPDIKKEDIKDKNMEPNLFWEDNLFYSHAPMYISANLEVKFKYVAVGLNHIVAISTAGKAYSWGRNTEGQLGLGNVSKFVCKPTVIEEVALKEFVMCIASHSYSAFLSQEGQISVCGTAEYGCLGINEIKQNYDVLVPKLVNDIPPAKYIAGGPQHMIAITANGEIYAWGNTSNGRTGLNINNEKALVPRQVQFDNKQQQIKFTQASCGFMHTLLLDEDGYIWAAGVKAYAGFPSDDGYRTLEEQETFAWIPDLAKIKFLHISSGEFHNLAVSNTEDRIVYGWGKSEYGKLAQNTFLTIGNQDSKLRNILLPKKMEGLDRVEYVSCGVNHSTCLNMDGDVYVWGCVLTGRLGIRVDELKFLKRQRQIKREFNVMTLNQPKKLLTYFEEEFAKKVEEFAQNNMQDFMNVSPQSQRKAARLFEAIKNENKEIEFAPNDFLDDEHREDEETPLAKGLHKKFTMSSPDAHNKLASFDTPAQYATTSDPVTAVTNYGSKKSESPERVNEDSPLLSGVNERETLLKESRSYMPNQLSKFGQLPGAETVIEERQSIRPSGVKKGLTDIQERMAKFETSTSKNDTKQNYMQILTENTNDKNYEQLLLQKLLQEEESENYEMTLMARDVELSQSFELLFKKIGEEVDKVRERLCNGALGVESLIQTSFLMLPKGVRKIKNLAHTIPSFILQNIQIYEGIVSMFYNHPCYLHKILKSDLVDANIVLDWVFKVYGSHKEDDRSINQVLALSLMVLEEEVETFPITQQSVVKLMSNFVKLYDFIQMSQLENVRFLREIAEHLLLNVVIQNYYPDFNASDRATHGKFQFALNEIGTLSPDRAKKNIQEDIEDYFNLEPYIKNQKDPRSEKFKRIVQRCLGFIERMEIYLKSILARPDFSVLGKMSPQIRYFHSRILEEYKNTAIRKAPTKEEKSKKDGVDATGAIRKAEFFILELFFGKLSKIIVEYKEHGIRVPKEYERILSPQNLSNLGLLITKYLQKEEIGTKDEITGKNPFVVLNDYINTHSRSTQVVNNLIRGMTSHDDYNITLDNLQRTLEDSMKVEERINCRLSVKDIINLQNFLIKNRENGNLIFIRDPHDPVHNDPVYVMVDYLKENQRELSSFAFEMLDYKVNLKINSKIMRKAPGDPDLKLYRCNFCQLVFPEDLLRREDMNLIHTKEWDCHKCFAKNPFTVQNCHECGSLIQEYKLQRKYIFKRYIPLIKKDQPLMDYFELLKTHPLIYTDRPIMTFLEEKMQAAAKTGRFDMSSMLSKIIHRFRTTSASLQTLAKDYKFNVGDIEDEKKMVSFLHDLFCDEFQIRRLHKKFLDQLQTVLARSYQLLAAGRHGANRLLEAMDHVGVKVAVSNAKYNGVVSNVLQKADSKEEEEIKLKLEADTCKPYAMFNSVDMRSQQVLASFVLHGKVVPKIVNNLKFYVFYRKNEGFTIKVVFIEDSWQNLLVRFGPWFINEVALDEFVITSEHFLELMRTANYKAETSLGYATFYVENLVRMLRDVLAKSNLRKIKKTTLTHEH